MTVGTELLGNIFDVLIHNNSKEKTIRRLYCESGHPAAKAYGFVNGTTRAKLELIIPKCKDCKHQKLRHTTMVLVFEELARLNESNLLGELHRQIGGPAKYASNLCCKKTQEMIQEKGSFK